MSTRDKRVLVLGTHNRKKLRELAPLIDPRQFALGTLADFANALEVEETGQSFAENAALKATQQAAHLGRWVVAEDSGLAVDVLNGAPGVYSARYAGVKASDQENNERLLVDLKGTPLHQRTARYVCHVTLADPGGIIRAESEAYCHGRIRCQAAGSSGFGYDPLFEIVEYHRTFAELGEAVKAVLSHRGRALRVIQPQLVALAKSDAWA